MVMLDKELYSYSNKVQGACAMSQNVKGSFNELPDHEFIYMERYVLSAPKESHYGT